MNISDLEIAKSNFIASTFIRTADESYCVARWARQTGFFTEFAWSATHALEKYMKAILLCNGHSAKDYGHDTKRLLKKIKVFCGDLIPETLDPNPLTPIHISVRNTNTEDLISMLHEFGNADARYGNAGWYVRSDDLLLLDSLVYSVRRVVFPLDDQMEGHPAPMTYRNWFKNNSGCLISKRGFLWERIGTCTQASVGSVANCNLAFAPSQLTHDWSWIVSSWKESPLERDVFRALQSDDRDWAIQGVDFADWLFHNVTLDAKTEKAIKKLKESAKLRHYL